MGLTDLITTPGQQVAYLFPEVIEGGTQITRTGIAPGSGPIDTSGLLKDVFVFQFWPSQVQDRYEVNYTTKQIPGGSHPLYQWVGGNGRTVSFDAVFVSELQEDDLGSSANFNSRIAAQSAAGPLGSASALRTAVFLPSSRYVVDIAGAIAGLQRYLYGTYNEVSGKKGIAEPPRKLVLVLPNTQLGRLPGADGILCILLRADVTMESWFPSGQLRAVTVSLEFAEVVQQSDGEGSNIKFIGADQYNASAGRYTLTQGSGFDRLQF